MLQKAGLPITPAERERIEVADFGLDELEKTGLEVLTYVNTYRVCTKEIVIFPHQTCPEHWHPTKGAKLGKEETFRCRWGKVYLYVPGTATENPACRPPTGSESFYQVWHEVVLNPGDQYTLYPIRRTGFRQALREQLSLSFPPVAPTTKTNSVTLASSAPQRSEAERNHFQAISS
jgi:D-lyxose ketol-isomerase